jgi:RNA 2',3'-cyclic 3'-phosphodiesterase
VPDGPHRLFVAIPIPEPTRESVGELLGPLRQMTFERPPRWVPPETLHLTLHFLGDTPPETVPHVAGAVRGAVGATPAFEVGLAGAGSFPEHGRKIRALWLGIADGGEQLGALADALTRALVPLGRPADGRPFAPHLTIARTDATSIRDAALVAQALEAAAARWSSRFLADRVVLYRSTLGAGPARHDAVETVVLRAPEG